MLHRPRRPRLLALLTAAVALGGALLVPGASAPAGAAPVPLTTVRYAVASPACPAPARGAVRCLAVQLTPAAKGTDGAQRVVMAATGQGPGGGYTPDQLAAAYRYDRTAAAGAGQTVAVVDAYSDPDARSELDAFDANYGLPRETSTSFRQVNQSGQAAPLPAANRDWAGEIALDVQAVRAVCQRCRILLVEASSNSAANLAAAVNTAVRLGATEVSNSYGAPEQGTANPYRSAYDHPGVVITASTGDDGWYDWDLANDGDNASDNAPEEPASYPSVVAVGGTQLDATAAGDRVRESVWNDNGPSDSVGLSSDGWAGGQGAAGGGCSTVYPAPSWQLAAAGWAQTGCGSKRLVADVAADAAPGTGFSVYASYGTGGWALFGGTSLAAPLIAGMWALAGGAGGVRYPAQSLYDHLAWAPDALYDVTTGGNGFCGGDDATTCAARVRSLTGNATGNPNNLGNDNPYYADAWAGLLDCGFDMTAFTESAVAANTQCTAAAGYDGPSGVGTPDGLAAFTRMGPSVSMQAPTRVVVGRAATFAAGFRDTVPGATAASYTWNWGDGTSSSGARAAHTYRARGTYTVSLTVRDSVGRTAQASRRYTAGYAPTLTLSGPTGVRHGHSHTWRLSAVERNTGGHLTGYSWRIGSRVYRHGTRFTHRFARRGRIVLTVTVTDDSGLRTTRRLSVRVS